MWRTKMSSDNKFGSLINWPHCLHNSSMVCLFSDKICYKMLYITKVMAQRIGISSFSSFHVSVPAGLLTYYPSLQMVHQASHTCPGIKTQMLGQIYTKHVAHWSSTQLLGKNHWQNEKVSDATTLWKLGTKVVCST